MTTSWAYATQGQWADAVRAHTGGTLLALGTAVAAVTTLGVAVCGRWPVRQPSEVVIISLVVVGAALLVGEWIVRLWHG